jgi:hypothetical protein
MSRKTHYSLLIRKLSVTTSTQRFMLAVLKATRLKLRAVWLLSIC